jgi:membrane-associated phospholipid phosphatase
MATVGVLILLLHGNAVPLWPWLVLAHAFGIALVHLLILGHARFPQNRLLDFLRHFYPILLYTGFYRETSVLNQMTITGFLDPCLARWEERIFGTQPSLLFVQSLPFRFIGELLYASYFSYYLMIGGVGLVLLARDRRQFFHYVSVVSFVFYVCYLIYIFAPVLGPQALERPMDGYELPARFRPEGSLGIPAIIQEGIFFQLMGWIYAIFESPGTAFPSSHVAVSLTTVYFSFRYVRPIRYYHLVLALLLCLSTVYGRYHYVVDVVAGAVAALVLVPLGNRLYVRYHEAREELGSNSESPTQSGRS